MLLTCRDGSKPKAAGMWEIEIDCDYDNDKDNDDG